MNFIHKINFKVVKATNIFVEDGVESFVVVFVLILLPIRNINRRLSSSCFANSWPFVWFVVREMSLGGDEDNTTAAVEERETGKDAKERKGGEEKVVVGRS